MLEHPHQLLSVEQDNKTQENGELLQPSAEEHGQQLREEKSTWQRHLDYRVRHVEEGYLTFISPFESAPVHCLNPRPS
jgi:hypothetical protein